MGAILCGSSQPKSTGNDTDGIAKLHQDNYAEDETNHASGWGVPPVKKPADPSPSNDEQPVTKADTALSPPEQQRRKSSAASRPKSSKYSADVKKVIEAIITTMAKPDHDDGSLGPIFIRLSWHSCGTFDATTKTGGSSSGATMRFPPERDDPENAGLDIARDALEPIHQQFPWMSRADLWVLAGTVAIKELGGPEVEVRFGRKDHEGPTSTVENGRLPKAEEGLEPGVEDGDRVKGWRALTANIRKRFTRMGFDDQEMVALICGGHVFGRTHIQNAGYAGAWVENPLEFSNEFAADLLGDEWQLVDGSNEKDRAEIPPAVCPAHGIRQYVSKPHSETPQMMLPSDMIFRWDEQFRPYTEKYAKDETLLRTDFAKAWKKLIELGCEDILHKDPASNEYGR